jgi:hypothetical protein
MKIPALTSRILFRERGRSMKIPAPMSWILFRERGRSMKNPYSDELDFI